MSSALSAPVLHHTEAFGTTAGPARVVGPHERGKAFCFEKKKQKAFVCAVAD
jgi:hypothetical protein